MASSLQQFLVDNISVTISIYYVIISSLIYMLFKLFWYFKWPLCSILTLFILSIVTFPMLLIWLLSIMITVYIPLFSISSLLFVAFIISTIMAQDITELWITFLSLYVASLLVIILVFVHIEYGFECNIDCI